MNDEIITGLRAALAEMGKEVGAAAARAYIAEGRAKAAEERAESADKRVAQTKAKGAQALADAEERERDALREAAHVKGLHDADVARINELANKANAAEVRAHHAEKVMANAYDGNARDKADRLQALRDLEAMRAERDAALGTIGTLKAEIRALTEKAAP